MSLSLVPPGPPQEPPMPPQLPTEPVEYVYMNAWQGGTKSFVAPQIHAKLLDLRREIKSLAAKRQPGVPFPVRGAKDLAQKMADALNKLDLIAPVVDQKFTFPEIKLEAEGKVKYRSLIHVCATVRVIAPDGSFVDMVGSGHGADSDDKAGGKASTYAWKDALLKGLTIPDQAMIDTDDAPVEDEPNTASPRAEVSHIPTAATQLPGLNYALTQIESAVTLDDMATIKKAIVSGSIDLSGGDKLRASAAYVAKEKLLKGK